MRNLRERMLSWLLILTTFVSVLPIGVFAEELYTTSETYDLEAETVEADGTIYVLAGSDFQPTDANNTTGVNLLNGILDKIKVDYTTFDGFLFAGDYDYDYTASQSGKEALQGAVQDVYGTAMDEVYIQGDHDTDDLVGSTLSASGNNDTDNYGVFVINEKDYMWYNDDETTIKNTAANLEAYLNAKRNAGYTKPIFVVSHLPLHYCMRTQVGGGDGKHANYIFDVLNEAGAAGLNIIFLFGHNHSHGWDDPYGGAAIFLKKGDSINIAQNSTTTYKVETLAFTYMNAGYVSYYRNVNSGAETDLSMTTFEITDTDVTISRYTADGEQDLKSAGVANTHAATGSSVDESCSTDHGGVENYAPDTTTVATNYVMPLSTEITPASAEVEAVKSSTDSTPAVATSGGDWETITEPTGGTTNYTYTQATSITAGEKYVIVADRSTCALMDKNGQMVSESVDISETTMTSTVELTEWTFSSASRGTIYDGSYYLMYRDKKFSLNQNAGNNNLGITAGNGANKNKFCIKSLDSVTTYYLYYVNTSGQWTGATSSEYVRLFQLTDTSTTGGTGGLYYKISGDLTYNVTSGTSAEDALVAVKNGIAIKYATASDYSDEADYNDDGEGMTWTLDSSYDGTTPGEYAVTISYNGTVLGIAKVVVPSVTIASYSIEPLAATVKKGSIQTVKTGSVITVTQESGENYTVPVTISMLSKDDEAVSTAEAGILTDLTVTYDGVIMTNNFTLNVIEPIQNNYPDYPNEGAVQVKKTATGIDFQSSGVAQVELSASGVPAQRGVDVVVVINTSSSMDDDIDGETPSSGEKSRIDILSESLADMIVAFQTPGDSGVTPDIDIAVIGFNGYSDRINGASLNNTYCDNADFAEVYTPVTEETKYIAQVGLSAANFVDVTTLDAATFAGQFNEDKTYSGTNYDSGLDNAYKLLSMKQTANGDEVRDQYVIFLSDGVPFRYNGYENGSDSGYDNWDKWLRGGWADQAALETEISSTTTVNAYPYFYNGNGTNHPHRIAEAIKGTKGAVYDVVINTATDVDPKYIQKYSGLGAKIYSIGFGLAEDGDGTGTDKGSVLVSTMQNVLQTISSGDGYCYDVDSADELTTAFTQIATAINYAATNAYFLDQMGAAFDLKLNTSTYETLVYDENGNRVDDDNDGDSDTETKTITPTIEVKVYDIYTRQDWLDGNCTESQIGDRKGTCTVIETITFNAAGTEAYSSVIGEDTNILADGTTDGHVKGVIYAKNFMYNTNNAPVTVNGITIAAESFYWYLGTVETHELALSYYVYLTGAMEGYREAGSYATNEYATLYYDNYLGNASYKETTSPTMAWESALVRYAFYLVDTNGNPVNNNGEVVTFAKKVAVTQPVVYEEILLNNSENINSIDVASVDEGVLPKDYKLYDSSAAYTVTISSNSTGSWEIVVGDGLQATTYVTGFSDTAQYSNAANENSTSYDYTHTTVWFAVVWKPQAVPDAVVIDYGLPVDIHVLSNDMFGDYGTLSGISADTTITGSLTGDETNQAPETEIYGKAQIITTDADGNALDKDDQVVRYTPSNMEMQSYDKFTYSAMYNNTVYTDNNGYYYGTVTVIPATTIYYEDSFLDYSTMVWSETEWVKTENKDAWTTDGTLIDNVQDEDRPGQYSLSAVDVNNIYGYDGAYSTMSTYSMGLAMKATVDYDTLAEASFTFYGTGFDVVGLSSNETGTIVVSVYAVGENGSVGEPEKQFIVDTYYGYTYSLCNVTYTYDGSDWGKIVDSIAGTDAVETPADLSIDNPEEGWTVTGIEYAWTISVNTPNTLYQVPVMKVSGLDYGKYYATIQVLYDPLFDHGQFDDETYDFYLDAIRIYDPAGVANGNTFEDQDGNLDAEKQTIFDAYLADGEAYPIYEELRNNVISANTFNEAGQAEGIVFIDSNDGTSTIDEYKSYGPNNELYLAKDQSIAFKLNEAAVNRSGFTLVDVQIGVKATNGNVSVIGMSLVDKGEDGYVTNYETVKNVNTTTDMYYSINNMRNGIIVMTNDSDNVVAFTNIKFTYKKDAEETSDGEKSSEEISSEGDTVSAAMFLISEEEANAVLVALNATEPEPEPTPEVTPEPWENPFTDVTEDAYYFDAVKYLNQNGIVNGLAEDTYGPNSRTSRGMLVTMLWRLEGEPAAAKAKYSDVQADKYYAKAVDWADEVGIVQGYEDGTFRPEDFVSRQEIVTILCRYAKYKGVDVTDSGNLGQFSDKDQIGSYAKSAMSWAIDNDVVRGYTDGTVRPTAGASRAEMAALLHRVLTNILGN